MTRPLSVLLWRSLVLGFLVVLVLALWLILRHQPPTFTIVDFAVPMSNSSDTKRVEKDHHGPDMLFTLVIKNPSIVSSVSYNNILLTVNYNQGTLGETTISGFKQGNNKEHTVRGHMEANVQLWETLLKAVSKTSSKPILKVKLKTGIRYKDLGYTRKQHDLSLQCQFKVGSDGRISGRKTLKPCKGSC